MMSSLHPTTTSEANMKPECIISSGYDPIKSEETDDEDCKDINTSNSHENHSSPINIKEEYEKVKIEVKTEDEVSTDDERSPEYVVSSSIGYDPVKSEETDDEELGEDSNTSNEHNLPIKEGDSMDGNDNSEKKEARRRRKSPRFLAKPTTQPGASSVQKSVKRRYESIRKREVEESNGSDKKTARIECSVEGCTRKAAGNGRCKADHGGYNLCSQEGCTKQAQKGGVCIKHGAKRQTCRHDGCKNNAVQGGVCIKHGAKKKTCSHEG